MSGQPHQSLYRQYRPQRFAEIRGQDHVIRALHNAVRTDRVGHAYLFSGPRGTGKTSTARILAKALNCTALVDGEPCGQCESCLAVQGGSSLDVLELDAASNNGVDAMRDLVARAALGSPGRWKVYIVDEVHMLSTPASNALLKTLEEPPGHVVFVLATTDPQKVLATIRSRAQHFEFHLLGPDVLGGLLRDVNADASLGVDDATIDQVVRRGGGSARDALSVLDQVVAAGGAEDEPDTASELVDALGDRDVGRALTAVAAACQVGRDPRRIAVEVVERLRQAFLATMAPALVGLPVEDVPALTDQAKRLGTPAVVRGMEVLGEALVAMRDALDTRVTLEVALVRLCAPEADTSMAAVLERVDRLERRAGSSSGVSGGGGAAKGGGAVKPDDPESPGTRGGEGSGSRPTLGALRRRDPTPSPPQPEHQTEPAPPGPAPSGPAPSGPAPRNQDGPAPDRDELTKAWGDAVLASLPPGARSVFRTGRWLAVDEGAAVFAVPNSFHLERAEARRRDVEGALAAHFGAEIRIRLVEDDGTPASGPSLADLDRSTDDEESLTSVEVAGFEVAAPAPSTIEDRLRAAFPGAEEVST